MNSDFSSITILFTAFSTLILVANIAVETAVESLFNIDYTISKENSQEVHP